MHHTIHRTYTCGNTHLVFKWLPGGNVHFCTQIDSVGLQELLLEVGEVHAIGGGAVLGIESSGACRA